MAKVIFYVFMFFLCSLMTWFSNSNNDYNYCMFFSFCAGCTFIISAVELNDIRK